MVNDVMSPKPQSEGLNVYPYIQYLGDIFILDEDAWETDKAHPTYNKVIGYATYSKLPLFSIHMSVVQLAQEFPATEGTNEVAQETPSVDEGPAAHNDSNEDSAVDNSMNAAFDAMDDFEVPDVEPDAAPKSDTEKYNSEGESELRDPFCNSKLSNSKS